MTPRIIDLDVVIFGGGVAGLWLLDSLDAAGYHAVLLESSALGAGQTIASQGILHGGVKYTLRLGRVNPSAEAVSHMPAIWRECLAGRRRPDLRDVSGRAEHCHLWRTGSLRSRAGMFGATHGLATKPEKLNKAQWPQVLGQCPDVRLLSEQVIDPASLLRALAERHLQRLLRIDAEKGLRFDGPRIHLNDPQGEGMTLQANAIVFAAGAGNAALREAAALSPQIMQRRPLHIVMVRGKLPELYGHCADGAATRVTITSAPLEAGTMVWQIGGQVSEDGVNMDEPTLIAHARRELLACIPGLSLDATEWATYRVDRAEARTADGRKPDSFTILRDGPFITAWPTKLVLAPAMVAQLASELPPPKVKHDLTAFGDWPRPAVARPPWESATWRSDV